MPSESLAELTDKLTSARKELLQQVHSMTDAQAAIPPAPGEWSAKQQLQHAIDAERAWRESGLRTAMHGNTRMAEQWQETVQAHIDTANARPLAVLMAELQQEHRRTLESVQGLTEEQLARKGFHVAYNGEMTALQMLRAIYRHDRMHIDQIAGRPSSYEVRRLG